MVHRFQSHSQTIHRWSFYETKAHPLPQCPSAPHPVHTPCFQQDTAVSNPEVRTEERRRRAREREREREEDGEREREKVRGLERGHWRSFGTTTPLQTF